MSSTKKLTKNAGEAWNHVANLKSKERGFLFTPAWFGSYAWDPVNNILYCGLVGRIPAIDLQSTLAEGTYELNEAQQALFDLSQTTISPGVDAMRARVRFGGGPSNHGLPDGFTITGLETIFPDASPAFTSSAPCSIVWASGFSR